MEPGKTIKQPFYLQNAKKKITKIQLEILFGSHDVYAPFTKKTHILNGENIKKNSVYISAIDLSIVQ
jgi:hypothetical protein